MEFSQFKSDITYITTNLCMAAVLDFAVMLVSFGRCIVRVLQSGVNSILAPCTAQLERPNYLFEGPNVNKRLGSG